MADWSLLGNAALVPAVMAFTQIAKKVVPKWNPDLVAIGVAIPLCLGYEVYILTDMRPFTSGLSGYKFVVDAFVSGVATAFTAGKSYDLVYGDKKLTKREEEARAEIEELKQKVSEGDINEPVEEDTLDSKLREILEETE